MGPRIILSGWILFACAAILAACSRAPNTRSTRPGIAPEELAALFVSGNTRIVPSYEMKRRLAANHFYRVRLEVWVCINAKGKVDAVKVPKHALDEYAAAIKARIRKWRYAPYMVDGVATPVCSSVTIEHSQEPGKYRPFGAKRR